MSKIYRKGVVPPSLQEFQFASFKEDMEQTEKGAEREFIPDVFSETTPEFIPGGFSFKYEGGFSAEEIEKRATNEADAIVNAAKNEAGKIKAEAEAEGFEKGKSEGFEEGLKITVPVIDTFTKLAKELTQVRNNFYEQAEEEMIDLTISIVKTVIGIETEKDKDVIRNVIRAAVHEVQSKEELTVVLNPEDLAEAEEFRQELRTEVDNVEKIVFKGDHNITRGGCTVQTNIGSIDARIETQLDAIRETLVQAMNENKKEGDSQTEDLIGESEG